MVSIIRADLYRLFRSKSLKVIFFISLIYLIGSLFPINDILYDMADLELADKFIVKYGYNAFSLIEYDALFYIFVPFLIVFYFSSEFSKKTIRNVFAAGLSRNAIFFGKYFAFSITIFLILFCFSVVSTIWATIQNGWGINFSFLQILNIIFIVLRVSLSQIAYSGVIIVLSLIIHSEATIVILYFIVSLIESFLMSMVAILQESNIIFYYLSYIFPSTYMNEFMSLSISGEVLLYSCLSMSLYCIMTLSIGSIWFNCFDINE